MFEDLHIVTLAPEAVAFTDRRVSYLYADLRDLPFRDAYYDTIISISTLEHVGMDNERYGGGAGGDDKRTGLPRAVHELKRVLSPGGVLLISVPYGVAEDHGWFQQFDRSGIDALVEAICPRYLEMRTYAYSREGWQISSLEGAGHMRYHDLSTATHRADDFAAAARAVVCIRAEL